MSMTGEVCFGCGKVYFNGDDDGVSRHDMGIGWVWFSVEGDLQSSFHDMAGIDGIVEPVDVGDMDGLCIESRKASATVVSSSGGSIGACFVPTYTGETAVVVLYAMWGLWERMDVGMVIGWPFDFLCGCACWNEPVVAGMVGVVGAFGELYFDATVDIKL